MCGVVDLGAGAGAGDALKREPRWLVLGLGVALASGLGP